MWQPEPLKNADNGPLSQPKRPRRQANIYLNIKLTTFLEQEVTRGGHCRKETIVPGGVVS
jgi:hypothetical protein